MNEMTRLEALEFLALSTDSTMLQVAKAYSEKYDFFQMLLNKAPNTVIKNLHQKNIDKLAAIKKILDIPDTDDSPTPVPSMPVQANDAAASTKNVVQDKFVHQVSPALAADNIAWLVLHTEHQPIKMNPLLPGYTVIGRATEASVALIKISNDRFVSRVHALITIEKTNGQYHAFISDTGKYGNGTASRNGVFINGREERLIGTRQLFDNDTLQIGYSKLVFKWNSQGTAPGAIEEEMNQTAYVKTIVIGL